MKTWTVLSAFLALIVTFTITPTTLAQQAPSVAQDASKDATKTPIPEAKPINVSGTWEWRIIPQSGSETTFTAKLKQDGESVKGSFDCLNCYRIVNNVPVNGTMKNGKLELVREDLAFSGFDLTTQSEDSMTGTYTGVGSVRYNLIGKRK